MSVFVMCAATAEPKSATEFYAAYKRYNLWLPPKNAKRSRNSLPSGQRTPAITAIAFAIRHRAARSVLYILIFLVDLNINRRIIAANLVVTLRFAIYIHHLMAGREGILFQVIRISPNHFLYGTGGIFAERTARPHQFCNLGNLVQLFDARCFIVRHDNEQVIPRTANGHIENVLLVQEHPWVGRDSWRWIENGDNDLALITLEAVNRANLNLYGIRLGCP